MGSKMTVGRPAKVPNFSDNGAFVGQKYKKGQK